MCVLTSPEYTYFSIHNICAWFTGKKNGLFVCGCVNTSLQSYYARTCLHVCFLFFPFPFSSTLRGWNYIVAHCLGAQSSTTPAKGENCWQRGGGEKGGLVYAVVARHEGPPPTLAPLKISVGTADRTTNTPSILPPTLPQCCFWLLRNKFTSAFFGRQKFRRLRACVVALKRG